MSNVSLLTKQGRKEDALVSSLTRSAHPFTQTKQGGAVRAPGDPAHPGPHRTAAAAWVRWGTSSGMEVLGVH